mgnify:CR=1 FL=1
MDSSVPFGKLLSSSMRASTPSFYTNKNERILKFCGQSQFLKAFLTFSMRSKHSPLSIQSISVQSKPSLRKKGERLRQVFSSSPPQPHKSMFLRKAIKTILTKANQNWTCCIQVAPMKRCACWNTVEVSRWRNWCWTVQTCWPDERWGSG